MTVVSALEHRQIKKYKTHVKQRRARSISFVFKFYKRFHLFILNKEEITVTKLNKID